jgi:hypothetical protein
MGEAEMISQATTAGMAKSAANLWGISHVWQSPTLPTRRSQRRLLTDPIVARLTLSAGEVEVHVPQPEPDWLYPVLDKLQHVSQLAENWDSYGGQAPSDESIYTALAVLSRILRGESSAPTLVPLSEGGVQIEWHGDGEELEIRIGANGEISAFRFDEKVGRGEEIDQVTLLDLSRLLALTGNR